MSDSKIVYCKVNTIHRTWLNYCEQPPQEEIVDPLSMTQPDMVMSLEELLLRHTRGEDVPIYEGFYDSDLTEDDEDIHLPNPKALDMAEIDDMIDYTKTRIKDLEKEAKRPKQQRAPAQDSEAEGSPAANERKPVE